MSIWWGLLLFYVGGALGMWIMAITGANRVAQAERAYWRRRTRLMRKRRAGWEERKAGRLAAAYYQSHRAALEVQVQVQRQTGKSISIEPVTFVRLSRGLFN